MGGRGKAAKRGGEKGEHEETTRGATLDIKDQQKRRSPTEKSKEPCGTPAGLTVKLPKPACNNEPFKDEKHALYEKLASAMMPILRNADTKHEFAFMNMHIHNQYRPEERRKRTGQNLVFLVVRARG